MKLKTLFLAGAAMLLASAAQAAENKTLERIRDRGLVVCGTDLSTKALAYKDDADFWQGIDAAICRNFAMAIFDNENAFELEDIHMDKASTAIKTGNIDIMLGSENLTASQELAANLTPAAVVYYDRLVFATREQTEATSMEEFKGAKVCALSNSADLERLKEYNNKYAMGFKFLPFSGVNELKQAFFLNRCTLAGGGETYLRGLKDTLIAKNSHITILPEEVEYRPVLAYTAKDDATFRLTAKQIINAPILAEEYGISSKNTDTFIGVRDASVKNLLGISPQLWQKFGLQPKWVLNAIKINGNFGEMYERNLGNESQLGIEKGRNKPISEGGILEAQPFI